MKILISPAKSLDLETPIPVTNHSDLMFESAVKEVQQHLKSFKASELKSKMKISDKIAALNWERNQQFTWPMTEGESRQAVFAFNGDVYKGLDAYSLKEEEIANMQDMLLILSGLYGMLKPLDLIQAYRLEMGTSMKVAKATSLVAYWKPVLTAKLNELLENGETLVNLASKEYSAAVDFKAIENKVVHPEFKDFKNGSLKTISFFAKKARGMMSRYLIENNAKNLEDILGFSKEGYAYSEEYSKDELHPVFVR
ncbi:MAG: peroxide stress protein YaaA [Flavobacteriaceae bacterium]